MLRLVMAMLFLALGAIAPALGQAEEDGPLLTPRMIGELTLDKLFEKLPPNAGSEPGRRIEAEILRRLHKSGSDTADLLMGWAVEATEGKNYPLALDLLDQVVILKPDFAEGWNKRATVYFLIDDYGASIADIRQTLALEPRHFGALAGLGMIFQAMDRDADAIRVFKRALEVNPQLDRVRQSLERLEKESGGNEI